MSTQNFAHLLSRLRSRRVEARYSKSSKHNLSRTRHQWKEFCEAARASDIPNGDALFSNPEKCMAEADPELVMLFLKWTLDTQTGIRKEITINAYYDRWHTARRQIPHHRVWSLEDRKRVNSFISLDLASEHGLSRERQPKPVLSFADMTILLNHLWKWDRLQYTNERLRVQVALVILISMATATRPAALLEPEYAREDLGGSPKVLCYEHVRLSL
ncbi:hypothetical protein EJ06DRAFT_534970, partial [Trichodelitschia bisporula]